MLEAGRKMGAGVGDRIAALELLGFKGSVQTRAGDVGSVVKVDLLKGTVVVQINGGELREFRATEVGDLDTAL